MSAAATVIAVVLSAIAAVLAGIGQLRQRKTEDAALVVGAQRDHMHLLTAENTDLRERLRATEGRVFDQQVTISQQQAQITSQQVQIGDLRVQVANCDADKNKLKVELDEVKRRITGIEGSSLEDR